MSQLAVEVRNTGGKGVSRKLRVAGRIPAVLYGQGKDPLALTLEPRLLERLLKAEGHNAIFDLEGSGVGSRTVLVKSVQRHPVRGELIHADFFEINVMQKITVSVALHLKGVPEGVKLEGGIVEHTLREVEIECLPRSIPDFIDVDVSAMHVGDTLHVSDIALPEGVAIMTHLELAVVSVVTAKEEAAEAAPAVAEVALVADADKAKTAGD